MEAIRGVPSKIMGEFEHHLVRPYRTYNYGPILKYKKGLSHWNKILIKEERGKRKAQQKESKWAVHFRRPPKRDFWTNQYNMGHKLKFDNII